MVYKSTMGDAPHIPLGNGVATFLASPYLNDPASQEKVVFIDAETGGSYTVGQLRKVIPRAAALFRNELGVEKNDVVGLFGTNHIFTPIIHFASLSLGAIMSPANIMYSAEELAHQLRLTLPKLLVVVDPAKPVAEEACKIASSSTRIVTFSELFPKLKALIAAENAPVVYPVDVDAKTHLAYLCFSSGTSGLPKGVMTTHYNIVGNILQQVMAKIPLSDPELSQNGLLPMSHIYGLNQGIWAGAYLGKLTLVFSKFDLELFVKKTIEHNIQLLFVVPPIVLALGKTDILAKYPEFGKTVKYMVSGAAPISKETIQLLNRRAPNIHVAQGYGLTETSPVSHSGFHPSPDKQAQYHQESIGWLLPGAEARLVAPETGKDVSGPNERGELWLRGPMVMAGYFKNAESTAATLTSDGWLKTGDIAIIDDLDQFHIVDRLKELIKSNGHQVAPAELESILLQHSEVLDSAVIGVLNEDKTSENPRAFLVLADPSKVSDVVKWFNQRVAKHKRLWGGAVILDAIPKSASGKIMRNDLRKRENDKVVGKELVSSANL